MTKLTGIMMVALMAMSVSAVQLVNYTGVTANGTMRPSDIDTDNGDTWNFSESVPLGTGSTTNSRIYGGMVTVWNDTNAGYEPSFEMTTTYGFRVYVIPPVLALGTSIKGMLIWEKADFLSGSSQPVHFAPGDSITAVFGSPSGTADMRIAVKQAGQWYVSSTNATVAATLSIDPTVATWRTITTDGTYTIGATASTLPLNDVQAVGVYASAVRSNNASRFILTSLAVNGSLGPTPTLKLVVLH